MKFRKKPVVIEAFILERRQLNWCQWADDNKRNDLGKLCAVFRALRDTGYLEEDNDINN